jgi:hypothetical protein
MRMKRNNYATTVEIHVGEFTTKTSFWPEVLETLKETDVRKIQSKVDEV